jgi:seryl-tRNA synthetase
MEGSEAAKGADATPDAMQRLMDALRNVGEQVEALNRQIEQVESELREHMLWIPNLPHQSVPVAVSGSTTSPGSRKGIPGV